MGATTTPLAVPQVVDAVVLGAGMSGLVSASVLLDQGAESVLVLDEYPRVGGNHLDVAIGNYTFDVGSFIFQDDSPLLEHFPELLPGYQPITPSWSRLNPQGRVTSYPFSLRDDVLAAGPVELLRIMASALVARLDRRPMANARDFARRWIGARFLRRSGLENYMARFCGCPIDRIDLTFAQSRMLWIRDQTTVPALLRQVRSQLHRQPPSAPTNRQLARPREGFAALYAPAVMTLERRGATFALGRAVSAVRRIPDGFLVETEAGTVRTARVVSTIPLTQSTALCSVPFPPLPAVTLVSLFYSFAGDRGFEESILYNFSHEARWKRLTVYSDFYGTAEGRTYFAVEVVADQNGTSVAEAAEEFRRHTAANGLLRGDLRLEGSHVLEQAYPIYTGGSAEQAAAAVAALKELGIESFGRQGAFRYQPTARVSALEAEAALRAA
ncbi:FAD-dependent oxidoreductase [uncultured Friedmanniella sp.]|uniref:FAD-dependent oxidoreductase n=1 Tax=uncultured Friedmanniella sp. TaxID=335381 RepID=UPI0035CC5132